MGFCRVTRTMRHKDEISNVGSESVMDIEICEQVPLGKKTAMLLKNINLLAVIKQTFGILTHNFQEIKDRQIPRDQLVTFHVTNNHWFLFFTTIENRPYAFAINRSDKNHYVIDMFENMPKTLYKNTLITGEVFEQYFFVNDLLVFEDNRYFYTQYPLTSRLQLAARILSGATDRDNSPFTFATKTYFAFDMTCSAQIINNSLAKFGVSKFKYFIFTPMMFQKFPNSSVMRLRVTDIRPNTNRETIDPNQQQVLTISKSTTLPDVYQVTLRSETGRLIDLGYACVVDRGMSRALKDEFHLATDKQYLCIFNRQFKKWQPLSPIASE